MRDFVCGAGCKHGAATPKVRSRTVRFRPSTMASGEKAVLFRCFFGYVSERPVHRSAGYLLYNFQDYRVKYFGLCCLSYPLVCNDMVELVQFLRTAVRHGRITNYAVRQSAMMCTNTHEPDSSVTLRLQAVEIGVTPSAYSVPVKFAESETIYLNCFS